MEITIYEENCFSCRMGFKFHTAEEHIYAGGTYFQMEDGVEYLVTYQYDLLGDSVTIKDLPLTWERLKLICFPDLDVYNHRILEIKPLTI